MKPTVDVITIGVTDMARMRQFYEQGLGRAVKDEHDDAVVIDLGAGSSMLELRPWDDIAEEVAMPPAGNGFRGFTLSCIVATAADVDDVMARLQRAGGEIAKPARGALWGYSGNVTDPSGCLWKIASTKRRPLVGRRAAGARNEGNGEETAIAIDQTAVTIGVADMKQAKRFYKEGLGYPVDKDYSKFVSFSGGDQASDLAMYRWEALADDAGVPSAGSGFRGFLLTHVTESAPNVDLLMDRAAAGGGKVVHQAHGGEGGRRSGLFTDLDDYAWKVISREREAPANDPGTTNSPQPRRSESRPRHARS